MASNLAPTLPLKTDPAPNFFSDYSVVLSVPLKEAYTTLGTHAGHERVCRLSKLCSGFNILEKDVVELPVPAYPNGMSLQHIGVRTTAATSNLNERGRDKEGATITRQHFTMEETVPILFGAFKTKVLLTGILSWDDSTLASLSSPHPPEGGGIHALYETVSDGGLVVWKLRTFTQEEGDPDKTRVTERIEGWAPTLLRRIVQSEATKAHKAHMELYHTLF